jgi:hypothetical protein
MYVVLKKGIENVFRKPEQEKTLRKLDRITKLSVFERNRFGGKDCFC